jgi:hypothetical protein
VISNGAAIEIPAANTLSDVTGSVLAIPAAFR